MTSYVEIPGNPLANPGVFHHGRRSTTGSWGLTRASAFEVVTLITGRPATTSNVAAGRLQRFVSDIAAGQVLLNELR